jgi:hypothetical protein
MRTPFYHNQNTSSVRVSYSIGLSQSTKGDREFTLIFAKIAGQVLLVSALRKPWLSNDSRGAFSAKKNRQGINCALAVIIVIKWSD